jgi:hypothetical protein
MMRRPSLRRVVLPALVITGALIWSYTEQRPQSGVVVRVATGSAPPVAHVRITKPKLRSTLAGGRIAAGASVRYRLQPGAYVIRPGRRRRLWAERIQVHVREGRFETVIIRYRPSAAARPNG